MIDLKEAETKFKKDTEQCQVEYQCSECGRYCIAKTIGEPICCLFNVDADYILFYVLYDL